jgi:hypothetical protein
MSTSLSLHAASASHSAAVSSASIIEVVSAACWALPDEATSGATSLAPAESDKSARLPHSDALTSGASSVVADSPPSIAAAKAPAAPASESAFCWANGSAPPVGPSVTSSMRL